MSEYALPQSTIDAFKARAVKAERENDWFAKNFPEFVVNDAVPRDTILAVNWKGIIDGMNRGLTYTEAVKGNCAKITGLL